MIDAIDMLIGHVNDKTMIIPGHGPICYRKDLVAYRDMLATVEARIKKGILDNLSIEEIKKENPIKGFTMYLDLYFNTEQVYNMVKKKMKK